jgi:DNA repair exonuclease SbcCD ATPase subunit
MLELIEAEKIDLNAREHRKRIEDARTLLESGALAGLKENIERLRAKKEALNELCQNSPVLRRKTELESIVNERTSELKTAKKTLEELNRDLQKTEGGIGKNKSELEEAASGVIGAAINITS